jgi:uncharacterized membrane protein YciS (DUF1049 family)
MLSEILTAVGFLMAMKKVGLTVHIKIRLKVLKKNQRAKRFKH